MAFLFQQICFTSLQSFATSKKKKQDTKNAFLSPHKRAFKRLHFILQNDFLLGDSLLKHAVNSEKFEIN